MAGKRYPLKPSPWTIKHYNDYPVQCLNKGCNGYIYPTNYFTLGQCSLCKEFFGWGHVKQVKMVKKYY